MKKVELLAPAGNHEALTGAVMAGADAVYLGGNAFGARAYADNFTEEEICQGIRFAHLYNCKIYLTVNTLIKEREITTLYDFLLPFYEAGLDGVIIQDLGVFQYIKKHFPKLSLHVSTQMTITGAYGARFLKAEGAERIVPARELSLEEIKTMKQEADIEIETFIHGAMCYCYSGQCLFSSILGGRSGNRGRCAQPCRLPYKTAGGKEAYLLSMKDMCTIENIPELIEAGIDSFKIEGRMKKPEYAAGVTAIYRKYIDLYYQNPDAYHVLEEDIQYLRSLYIRSEIMDGYYHKHNGKEMITIDSPAYSGSDDELLHHIRTSYIEKPKSLQITASAVLKKDRPALLTLSFGKIQITAEGAVVQEARKQPLSAEKIKEQLLKSGNTVFEIVEFHLQADDDIFMPVSVLNQLRRDAIKKLEDAIIAGNGLGTTGRTANPCKTYGEKKYLSDITSNEESITVTDNRKDAAKTAASGQKNRIHVLVTEKEQLQAALSQEVERIYLDRNAIREDVLLLIKEYREKMQEADLPLISRFYLAFPYIVRRKDENRLIYLHTLLQEEWVDGALVRNLETLSFLQEKKVNKPMVTDAGLYMFNAEALVYLQKFSTEQFLPVELNAYEIRDLLEKRDLSACGQIVYGRLPMMLSANCLKKTTDNCRHQAGYTALTDRYQKEFPVYTDCTYCYNILYNSVPLSLHKHFAKEGNKKAVSIHRLDFTTENLKETTEVIRYFKEIAGGSYREPAYREFTTGHDKRGVE